MWIRFIKPPSQFERWFPVVCFYSLIFYLSSLSELPEIPPYLPHWDKIHHFCEFFIFGFLLARATFNSHHLFLERKVQWLALVLLVPLLGASDEFHQYFVPGRSVDGSDLLADMIGGYGGMFLFYYLLRLAHRKALSHEFKVDPPISKYVSSDSL